ncbi:hypothetical protein, partial [Escherichia coli]|uniref:hypothetical protein n=1 Tax=Escherichia coli TaxID=562 RepID=UPI001A90C144
MSTSTRSVNSEMFLFFVTLPRTGLARKCGTSAVMGYKACCVCQKVRNTQCGWRTGCVCRHR